MNTLPNDNTLKSEKPLNANATGALALSSALGAPLARGALGTLYLVPAPLDFGCAHTVPLSHVLSLQTMQIASTLEHWVCENAKTLRAYLKRVADHCPLRLAIQHISMQELPRVVHKKGDHSPSAQALVVERMRSLLSPALQGLDVGLVSEAGMPAVADPGSSLVRLAHELGIKVVPLVGPCSVVLALSAMGLNGQSFAFVGYVPHEALALQKRLKELEQLVIKSEQTQLLIETPYRNNALLKALLANLRPSTRVGVSVGLTLEGMQNICLSVSQWRSQPIELPQHVPAVFAIGL